MKFANIDDAIMEAAKKPAPAKPAAKVAPKKAEPKKVEAPAPKKKAVAPAPAAPKKAEPKKAEPKKKPAAAKPEKKAEPKKELEKSVQPWSTKGREARSKELASMSSQEREKESEASKRKMGLRPASRGIGDRLKSAWKAFTAKPGSSVDIKKSYKSVFHEIQKLMEQLQLVESMLREQSLNESYDAGTVNNLYAHRNAIRSVLVEQIVREELYQHNVTIAELDQRQRAALMETVNVRANALWEGLEEAESEEEYDPNSFETSADHIEWSTTPQDDDDDDYDTVNYSNWDMPESYTLEEWMGMMEEAGVNLNELSPELLARYSNKVGDQLTKTRDDYDAKRMGDAEVNARLDKRIKGMGMAQQSIEKRAQTPQGRNTIEKAKDQDKTATAQQSFDKGLDNAANAELSVRSAQQAKQEREKMGLKFEEAYTLEEWMGMMEEAGVNLNELSPELLKRYAKASKADMQKNLAKSTEKTLHVPGRARAEKRFQGQTAAFKRLGGDPDLAESINENTVARLQSLAGINPTE